MVAFGRLSVDDDLFIHVTLCSPADNDTLVKLPIGHTHIKALDPEVITPVELFQPHSNMYSESIISLTAV